MQQLDQQSACGKISILNSVVIQNFYKSLIFFLVFFKHKVSNITGQEISIAESLIFKKLHGHPRNTGYGEKSVRSLKPDSVSVCRKCIHSVRPQVNNRTTGNLFFFLIAGKLYHSWDHGSEIYFPQTLNFKAVRGEGRKK